MDPFVVWLTVALGGLATFTGMLVRYFISDLTKTRDTAIAGWTAQTEATKALTEEVRKSRSKGR